MKNIFMTAAVLTVAISSFAHAGTTSTIGTAKWNGTANNMASKCKFVGQPIDGVMNWNDASGYFYTTDPAKVTLKVNKAIKVRVLADNRLYEGNSAVANTTVDVHYGQGHSGQSSAVVVQKGPQSLVSNATFNSNTIDFNLDQNAGGKIELRIAGKATPNSDDEIYAGFNYTVKHTVTCEQ
jgi:hypothetical protein